MSLFDGINTLNFVGLLCAPVIVFQDATGFAAVNPAYDGENGSIDAMLIAGNSFDCGQTITLQATWEFDPNGDPFLNPYFNSAVATGDSDGDMIADVTDLSDSGFDNEDSSDGEPGAIAGQFDDPTLIMVPSLHLTKEVLTIAPAASGTIGNWDVTFHIILENTGNVDLENIAIDDDLAANPLRQQRPDVLGRRRHHGMDQSCGGFELGKGEHFRTSPLASPVYHGVQPEG